MKPIQVIIIITIAAVLIGSLWYKSNSQPIGGKREVPFSVASGESLKSISNRLVSAGLIRSKFIFEWYAKQHNLSGRLQAGNYTLNTGQTIGDIAASLLAAKRQSRRILIREGETVDEIAKIFSDAGIASSEEFLAAAGQTPELRTKYDFLSDVPLDYKLEGYLFPDTYDFFIGTTAEDAIRKMLDNFGRKVSPELRDRVKAQGKSLHDVVTLASVVEREVRKPEDMKIVAGIFWSRLGRGQALQSDATLSYALKDNNPAHSKAELETDTPYNTYKYPGLPPTPISNPGLNAIIAVIDPSTTDYNFFLTAKDGTVHYAKNFSEHILNKNKYLK